MKNKHAFLIGVYKAPEYLEVLFEMLKHERSKIYVHVNRRNWSEFSHLEDKYKSQGIIFLHDVEVNWGGSSFMDSILKMISHIIIRMMDGGVMILFQSLTMKDQRSFMST